MVGGAVGIALVVMGRVHGAGGVRRWRRRVPGLRAMRLRGAVVEAGHAGHLGHIAHAGHAAVRRHRLIRLRAAAAGRIALQGQGGDQQVQQKADEGAAH